MSLRILFSSVGGRGRIFLGAIAMTALIIGAGCSSAPPVPGSFYSVPAGSALRGKPGDILRTEPVAGAPGGASAVRILYVSSGVHGNPILVSGVVIFPTAAPTNGPRGVVAWAHATTGVAEGCAPSLLPHVFATIPGLSELLTRGYAVAWPAHAQHARPSTCWRAAFHQPGHDRPDRSTRCHGTIRY